MNLSPNAMAVVVAFLYGLGVFPWGILANRVGPQGVLMFVGAGYFLVGSAWYLKAGLAGPVDRTALTAGAVTGLLFAGAVALYSAMLAHPQVNVPVANAITATYPMVTVLTGVALTAAGLAR